MKLCFVILTLEHLKKRFCWRLYAKSIYTFLKIYKANDRSIFYPKLYPLSHFPNWTWIWDNYFFEFFFHISFAYRSFRKVFWFTTWSLSYEERHITNLLLTFVLFANNLMHHFIYYLRMRSRMLINFVNENLIVSCLCMVWLKCIIYFGCYCGMVVMN